MFARLRRHATFANVCSALALLIALGAGTAYAANTVGTDDIIDSGVKTPDLDDEAVTTVKLADGAVTQAKIADAAVDSGQLAPGAVGSAQLASGAVGSSHIASGAVGSGQLAAGAVGGGQLATDAVDSSKVADDSLTMADVRGADATVPLNMKARALPRGGCKGLKLAVPGAAVGEVPLISVEGALPAGTFVTADRVPSAGTVAIKVCNLKRHGKRHAIKQVPARVVTFG